MPGDHRLSQVFWTALRRSVNIFGDITRSEVIWGDVKSCQVLRRFTRPLVAPPWLINFNHYSSDVHRRIFCRLPRDPFIGGRQQTTSVWTFIHVHRLQFRLAAVSTWPCLWCSVERDTRLYKPLAVSNSLSSSKRSEEPQPEELYILRKLV